MDGNELDMVAEARRLCGIDMAAEQCRPRRRLAPKNPLVELMTARVRLEQVRMICDRMPDSPERELLDEVLDGYPATCPECGYPLLDPADYYCAECGPVDPDPVKEDEQEIDHSRTPR